MSRYICVHGHFYQPPREDPWTEEVEPEPSAAPYHDWNERIAAECYAPNATARILGPDGQEARTLDNYARISFNFGPTLLSWLERRSPATYAAVLRADRDGTARFSGHGPALAQPYNHMILPLAPRRDKETQVRWGLADFERRFGRRAEGMWLPETAADLETLEVLAAHGLRFTLLAPHQAARTRPLGAGAWSTGELDTGRAYLQRLPSGRSIALFFYHGGLARAVAFESLLSSGERFHERLLGAFVPGEGPRLVHLATDGETYGHHHRFGEMALAWALERVEAGGDARLTVYGEFLEKHPPEREVAIHENRSWSCSHGVERWRADCGCATGAHPGWSQAWRWPLRAALDGLRDALAGPFERAAGRLLRDPWAARDAYAAPLLDRSEDAAARFLKTQARRPLPQEKAARALKLLELQRHALLMYTSCGWFFDDIAGLEARQVLRYAARAVELARELFGEDPEPAFLEALARARGNDPAAGDGKAVYLGLVRAAGRRDASAFSGM